MGMGLLRCYSSSWWWSTNRISQGYSLSLKSFLPQGSTSHCFRVTGPIWCYSSLWWWSTNRSTQSYPLDLESILPYDLNAQCWRGTNIIWCYSSLWRWYPLGPFYHKILIDIVEEELLSDFFNVQNVAKMWKKTWYSAEEWMVLSSPIQEVKLKYENVHCWGLQS